MMSQIADEIHRAIFGSIHQLILTSSN